MIADLIGFELEAAERARQQEETLALAHLNAQNRERFIAILGHELRNPLTAIRGSAQLLRRRAATASDQQLLSSIVEGADRMNRLVAEVVDFTRARLAGGIIVRPAPADLRAVTTRSIDDVRSAYPSFQITLDVEGETSGEWDSERLQQVMINLLTNAALYASPGTAARVNIKGSVEDVRLEISNNGPAIPDESLNEIFNPFRRGGAGEARGGGLGLGLYIVDQIVQSHRGTITVRSAAEQTTFTITLPRHIDRG